MFYNPTKAAEKYARNLEKLKVGFVTRLTEYIQEKKTFVSNIDTAIEHLEEEKSTANEEIAKTTKLLEEVK